MNDELEQAIMALVGEAPIERAALTPFRDWTAPQPRACQAYWPSCR